MIHKLELTKEQVLSIYRAMRFFVKDSLYHNQSEHRLLHKKVNELYDVTQKHKSKNYFLYVHQNQIHYFHKSIEDRISANREWYSVLDDVIVWLADRMD